jgi:hypothetical protein
MRISMPILSVFSVFDQGSIKTTKESTLPPALAVTSQHPSVGKYKPVAWKRVG